MKNKLVIDKFETKIVDGEPTSIFAFQSTIRGYVESSHRGKLCYIVKFEHSEIGSTAEISKNKVFQTMMNRRFPYEIWNYGLSIKGVDKIHEKFIDTEGANQDFVLEKFSHFKFLSEFLIAPVFI